ncbi:MAG: FeoA family protein [Deltaproteobacteria bacterium]|nr:FeoA family protein [Deltaproteobacteria bacterium]
MTQHSGNQNRPLAGIPPGQQVRIVGYEGGRMLRARLMSMGLNIGQVVSIVQNNRGLIILSVNGSRLALGRGVSQKIFTSPVELPA